MARVYNLDLVGHYISFNAGVTTHKVWRETIQQTGPVNAEALRRDLNKSFLAGGRNEVKDPEAQVPHIALLKVVDPKSHAVLDFARAPMFEVVA